MKPRKPYVGRYWCGFVDGKLDCETPERPGTQLYFTRLSAQVDDYQDVRRVEVREIPARKKVTRG